MRRTAKEHASYEKEIDTQTEKIERMKAENKSFHDIKQQVRRKSSFPAFVTNVWDATSQKSIDHFNLMVLMLYTCLACCFGVSAKEQKRRLPSTHFPKECVLER
jgi:hypothetical protein